MKISYLAFTEKGFNTAEKIRDELGGEVYRCGGEISLAKWTKEQFSCCDAIVFVGATGIAVRAIAPYIKGKDKDPAVVVVDELRRFAISLLSGHLGGANELACEIADIIGAQPVITTATDLNKKFAVDIWSKAIDAELIETNNIKTVSSKVLRGEVIKVFSPWVVDGDMPGEVELSERQECDVCVDIRKSKKDGKDMLHLIPKIGILGIGCRKNTAVEAIEEAFEAFTAGTDLYEEAVKSVVSIDLKENEKGIIEFCKKRGVPFKTYSKEQLASVDGVFTESEFVRNTTGVDNVCERSVVYAGGTLIEKKFAYSGVTFAFGILEYVPTWNREEQE